MKTRKSKTKLRKMNISPAAEAKYLFSYCFILQRTSGGRVRVKTLD